jgi:hypothetical protein
MHDEVPICLGGEYELGNSCDQQGIKNPGDEREQEEEDKSRSELGPDRRDEGTIFHGGTPQGILDCTLLPAVCVPIPLFGAGGIYVHGLNGIVPAELIFYQKFGTI